MAAAAPEVLRTSRGKPLLVTEDGTQLMAQHKLVNGGTEQVWRCIYFDSGEYRGCKARGRSDVGGYNVEMESPHMHDGVPAEVEKRRKLIEVERLASTQLQLPTKNLIEQAYQGLSAAAAEAMPDSPALARRIERKRVPEDGGAIDVPPAEIQWNRRNRETSTGDRFLLVDSRETEPELLAFLVFASVTGIRLLREVKTWAMDGTFYSSPRHFTQLYTFNVVSESHSAPCVFMLLPDKSEATYLRAFRATFGHADLQGARPDLLLADFEIAARNAALEIFPGIDIQHCWFHMNQNLYKNIQQKDLVELYRDCVEARALLRCLPALGTLPHDEVRDGLEQVVAAIDALLENGTIERRYEQGLMEYIEYFQRYYVYQLRGPQGRQRLEDSVFPVPTWSIHRAIVNRQPRTNNSLEAWHRIFNDYFARGALPLSRFLIYLRMEESTVRRRYNRGHLTGVPLQARPQRARFQRRDSKLKKIVDKYMELDAVDRNKLAFLRRIQRHLSSEARFNGDDHADAADVHVLADAAADANP